jgi:hypothetical protein
MALNAFLDQIEKLCERLGIAIEGGDDHRVYYLGIRLAADASAALTQMRPAMAPLRCTLSA